MFIDEWNKLEARFKKQAEVDEDIFLPNLAPSAPVNHLFIAMEPSLGRWATGDNLDSIRQCANDKIHAGFRNFMYSLEDFLLHYSIKHYLCPDDQTYHITDLSKGAMLVRKAKRNRDKRYDNWYGLLTEEINLVRKPNASIWAIGKKSWNYDP